MKWFYIIVLAVTAALVLAPFWLMESEDLSRFKGKIVSYSIYRAKVKSIDPATCGDTTSAAIQGNFYEGLYTYHYLKRPLEIIPDLAAGMPVVSDDGLVYTIKLKEDVKYSRNPCFGWETDKDGKKTRPKTRTLKAQDFVLAYKRVGDNHINTRLSLAFVKDNILGMDEYNRRTQNYAPGDFSRYKKEKLVGVEAVDDLTLRFTLAKPFPQFIFVLAMQCYAPIPEEVVSYHLSTKDDGKGGRVDIPIEDRDPEITKYQAAVGTGAFVMTNWVSGSKIILERHEEYRDVRYPSEGAPGDEEKGLLKDKGKRLPFVDAKYLLHVREPNPQWMLFLTKQCDYSSIPPQVYQTVVSPDRELLGTWSKQGITLEKDPYPAIYWIAFNLNDPVVGKSKSLRQGLYLAFDVEQYIETVWNGRGKRAVNIIPSTFKGYKEAGPGPYARVDLEAAKKKIEEAKKELVAAGVIGPGEDIPTITLDLGGRDETTRRMAEFIKGEFRKVGVRLNPVISDWPVMQDKINNKRFQTCTLGWHADYPDAENFLQNFYSPNIDLNTNYVSYNNPEFDRLFREAGKFADVKKRVPLYAKMAQMIAEDVPVMLLSEPITYTLLRPWTKNFKYHPIAYGLGKYTRIDIDARVEAGGRE